MVTELIFRYSLIYEQMIAKLASEPFDDENIKSGYEYVKEFTNYWKPFNNKIFKYYDGLGLTLADFWICYFVHSQKNLIPFSDPMTQIIKEDKEAVAASIIHEISHVFLDYYANSELYKKLWDHIEARYPSENFITKVHLIVIILARYGLVEIYGLEKTNSLLLKEKKYPGLDQAWNILDSKSGIFSAADPIQSILSL